MAAFGAPAAMAVLASLWASATAPATTTPYNPFQVRTGIGNLPPAVIVDPPAGDTATPANDEPGRAANSEPQS